MTEAAHDAKFLELTTDVLGSERATHLLAVLHQLPRDLQLRELTSMCIAQEGHGFQAAL
jgi:hypothetical protein